MSALLYPPAYKTGLLSDGNTTTCLTPFTSNTDLYLILIAIDTYRSSYFKVTILGSKLHCTQFDGIMVIPYDSCGDSYGACSGSTCILRQQPSGTALANRCDFHCTCGTYCAHVLFTDTYLDASQLDTEICELVVA